MRRSFSALLLGPMGLTAGCDLLGIPTTVELPIPLESPPVDLDVGGPVDEAVASSCADPSAVSCQGIGLICAAENGGAACDPVTLPPQFPATIDNLEGEPVPAEELLPEAVTEAAQIRAAIPVDLADLLNEAGVTSPEQVKDINVKNLVLAWDANTLTFDAPVLDVYIGPGDADVSDPVALIASADFEKVGAVGKDLDPSAEGFEVGQEAGVGDEVPLTFQSGGNAAFNERLKTFSFTLVVAAPDGQALKLKGVPGSDPPKVAAPDGEATLKLKAELVYTVDLAAAAGVQ